MFTTCLFCHAALGANRELEVFPVGRRLAFDPERGRLWVICAHCARWNLTPLETRWEALEACERAYRGTAQRVSTDNVGLARLRDGTDLVRIGRPLLPEFAHWRYGEQLGARRRRYSRSNWVMGMGLASVGGVTAAGVFGAASSASFGLSALVASLAGQQVMSWHSSVRNVTWTRTPDLQHAVVIPWMYAGTPRISFERSGDLRVQLRGERARSWARVPFGAAPMLWRAEDFTYTGEAARRAISDAMASVNFEGADSTVLSDALERLDVRPSANELLRLAVHDTSSDGPANEGYLRRLPPGQRLALEIALHEEDERRALAGELGVLYARWQEAEQVAQIADGELTRSLAADGGAGDDGTAHGTAATDGPTDSP